MISNIYKIKQEANGAQDDAFIWNIALKIKIDAANRL